MRYDVSVSACQFSRHGEVGEETEADICIVYPSLVFRPRLCNLTPADSQHLTTCLLNSNGDRVFLWADVFFFNLSKPHINRPSWLYLFEFLLFFF